MCVKKTLLVVGALLAVTAPLASMAEPPPPDAVIYGIGFDTAGRYIYKIELSDTNPGPGTGVSEVLYDIGQDPSGETYSPNGLATDSAKGLMYYSVGSSVQGSPTQNNKLYSIDLNALDQPPQDRGTIVGYAGGAVMYEGNYYYIDGRGEGSLNVYRVTFKESSGISDGDILSTQLHCTLQPNSPGVVDANTKFKGGDLVGLQGVIYGSALDSRSTSNGNDDVPVFFRFSIGDCNDLTVVKPTISTGSGIKQLQLAWGMDYKLYGQSPGSTDPVDATKIYVVDRNTGEVSPGPEYSPPLLLSDLDAPPPEARVTITKTNNYFDPQGEEGTVPEIPVGSQVIWTYEIKNAGQLGLTDVTVTDDKVAAADIDCDGGDNTPTDNVISSLDVGASKVCEATGTAVSGAYTNIGTVTAKHALQFEEGLGTVTDSDDDRYLGVTPTEDHDVALLVIDRDSLYDSARCYKYKYGRCYKFRKDDPDDDEGDEVEYKKGAKSNKYGPLSDLRSWAKSELGEPGYGKRDVLPWFNANVGTVVTLATGNVYKHSKYGSAEGWHAPDCIPQKWLSPSASATDNTCMTTDPDRREGINNFLFDGKTPYGGAPSSTSIEEERLERVPYVLPLRARGLKLLEGTKVCAVVYADDVKISYQDKSYDGKKKSKYGESACAGDDSCVWGDLSGKTYGIVAFEVMEARDRDCKYCLPDVDVKVLDPAETCNSVVLYNAPVPSGAKYPKDIAVDPLYDQTDDKKGYLRLFYDEPNENLLF